VMNAGEAVERLAAVLPDLDRAGLLARLQTRSRFQWVARNLAPKQQYDVNRLGLPGFGFQRGERRVYPHGPLVAHVLGLTDVDGRGIAGIERRFDRTLRAGERLGLAVDLRIQALMHEELAVMLREFDAVGAAGLVLDVDSGEVVAMVSLPDFDPNDPASADGEPAFNRVTKGVYEMGSTFKLFTAAMALDSGTVNMQSAYDARQPIQISQYVIRDFHAKNRWLSVPEIVVYSSNIGAAKMAVDVGTKAQQTYLGRFGMLTPTAIELPEVAAPLTPSPWREINTMTIAYGHGIAVTPMQVASGVATLVNGGLYVSPTLLGRIDGEQVEKTRVLTAETSDQMRKLMRLVVSSGTGRKADVSGDGYAIGGKTGTADKLAGRGYGTRANISSFVGAFPIDRPRFVVLVLVDEPKGNQRTFNYATGGWVAAPVVGRIVKRIATLIGMPPERHPEVPPEGLLREARAGAMQPRPVAVPKLTPKPAVVTAEDHMLDRVRAVLAAGETDAGTFPRPHPGHPEKALATP
jgi:cell division protein FtsI (penicillin-binding protein 3)